MENIFGLSIDFSWIGLASSLISIFGILVGAVSTVKPIRDQTYKWVGFLSFLMIFVFRMVAWVITMIMLERISVFPMALLALVNWITLISVQDKLEVSPLEQSILSMVYPVYRWPDIELNEKNSLRIFTALVLAGNIFFAGKIIFLRLPRLGVNLGSLGFQVSEVQSVP